MVSENMFHLVNEYDQARKSHTRARLYITACFKTIWHLHSGQDLVPLVSAIASKISMVQIENAKKKGTLNTCKMFKMSSLSPFADLPFTLICHTIPLPYRILLVMGPPKKCQAAGQRWHVLWLTQSPRFSWHTLRYSNMICWKIHHLRRTFQ